MKNADKPITPLHGADGTLFSSSTVDESAIKSLGLLTGLTKREYFAGLAMQGLIGKGAEIIHNPADVANYAVDFADELLKQLDK